VQRCDDYSGLIGYPFPVRNHQKDSAGRDLDIRETIAAVCIGFPRYIDDLLEVSALVLVKT